MTQPPTIMPTIISGQTSNSSSIGIPIAHSICVLLPRPAPTLVTRSLPVRYLVQLHQLADHLVLATVANAGGDAGVEVALQDHRFHLLDGAADGVRLLEDLRTVLIILDHAADACQVALDVVESFEDAQPGGVFHSDRLSHNPYPLGGGLCEPRIAGRERACQVTGIDRR